MMQGLIIGGILILLFFFFQAEDGIRDLVRSRGLGDVYKRQLHFLNQRELFLLAMRFAWLFGGDSVFHQGAGEGLSLIHI